MAAPIIVKILSDMSSCWGQLYLNGFRNQSDKFEPVIIFHVHFLKIMTIIILSLYFSKLNLSLLKLMQLKMMEWRSFAESRNKKG